MVLPDGEEFIDQPVVVLDDGHGRGPAACFGDHLGRVVFGQPRELDGAQGIDGAFHLGLPLAVELVPVGVVVAGPLLEDGYALLDPRRVLNAQRRDVDVPVDHADVQAQRHREGEDAGAERADAQVHGFGADAVERVAAAGPVHGVSEPELGILVLGGFLRGDEVVGVHRLPALTAGRGGGFVEEREACCAARVVCVVGHDVAPCDSEREGVRNSSSSATSARARSGLAAPSSVASSPGEVAPERTSGAVGTHGPCEVDFDGGVAHHGDLCRGKAQPAQQGFAQRGGGFA